MGFMNSSINLKMLTNEDEVYQNYKEEGNIERYYYPHQLKRIITKKKLPRCYSVKLKIIDLESIDLDIYKDCTINDKTVIKTVKEYGDNNSDFTKRVYVYWLNGKYLLLEGYRVYYVAKEVLKLKSIEVRVINYELNKKHDTRKSVLVEDSDQVENIPVAIDSREIAELMGVSHKTLLRKIEGSKDGKIKGIIPVLTNSQMEVSDYFIKSSYKDKQSKLRKCCLCTVKGVKMILDSTRNYNQKEELFKWYFENTDQEVSPILIDRDEVNFFNELEDVLKSFDIKGIKQYPILKYRIDYYIPQLNLAIEYDEGSHTGYTYEQHDGRQIRIEKELGCEFIRVSNKDTIGENIGLVLKEMIRLNKYIA